jgi:hypothetical protein
VQKAGEIRFVPVLLTTMTAIGGLLPIALGGSALYAPLAWVIIGGLISSTVLARLVTPVMYKLLPPARQHASEAAQPEEAEEKAFGTENLDRLEQASKEAGNRKTAGGTGRQAAARLELDPDKPLANSIAAESHARKPERDLQDWADQYFRRNPHITVVEGKDVHMGERGYSGYKEFDRTEAIRAFAKDETASDRIEVISKLDIEAEYSALRENERIALKSIRCVAQFKNISKKLIEDADLQEALSEWSDENGKQ